MGLNLSAKQKTAILIVSLPPEVSTQIMREFSPEQTQEISAEIAKLPNISSDVRNAVIDEFFSRSSAPSDMMATNIMGGGAATSFAEQVLKEGLTEVEGKDIVSSSKRPLGFLRQVEPEAIVSLLKREHPQSIALVLSYLEAKQASDVLRRLSASLQTEVARRLAEIQKVDPDVLVEIESLLQNRLKFLIDGGGDYGEADGREVLLNILSKADKSTEERILTGLTRKNPGLVRDLKRKLCDFDDLQHINDEGLREVIRLADTRDLILALKGADPQIVKRVYRCMAPEAAKALKEDMDALPSGRVDEDQVRAAQQEIRNILRNLVSLGKVRIAS
ncbi:MAG: FliG C-terminal domain-containing protein [Candidatus Eremiobacterota bacterium]